jgi:toxin ParE1/3/4
MNVHWNKTAIDHVAAIYDYIALGAEEYAKRMVDRLTKRSEQMGIPLIPGEWYRNLRTNE